MICASVLEAWAPSRLIFATLCVSVIDGEEHPVGWLTTVKLKEKSSAELRLAASSTELMSMISVPDACIQTPLAVDAPEISGLRRSAELLKLSGN